MLLYRCKSKLKDNDFSASYTCTVNGQIQKGSCGGMFTDNATFNSPVVVGNNVDIVQAMFSNCTNFNRLVTFPLSVTNLHYVFAGCTKYNQNFSIRSTVTVCSSLFENCISLNQNILIPSGVKECTSMFMGCSNLNQNIRIPQEAEKCWMMFRNCTNLNQDFTIPKNVTSCYYMFGGCNSLSGKNIYINGSPDCTGMFHRKTVASGTWGGRLNIFCNNISVLVGTGASNSIMATAVTWTAMTNGYYNSTYNLYLYNNYVGT